MSLQAQKRELDEYAERNGLTIVARYVDAGRSGTTDQRPEFQRMREELLSPSSQVGLVLVTHSSRFSRDSFLAELQRREFTKHGIALIATQQPHDDSPTGTLVQSMLGALSQFEAETIGVRARAGMNESARRGFFPHHRPPFGFALEAVKDGGKTRHKLVLEPTEAETVRVMARLYLADLGGVAVAEQLNAQQKLHRGQRWTQDAVLHVLGASEIAGTYLWGKSDRRNGLRRSASECIRIQVEPIIDEETLDKIAAARAERDPVKNPGRASSSSLRLGRGLTKCGVCGSSLELQTSGKQRPDGSRYSYYQCKTARRSGVSSCRGEPIPTDELEAEVAAVVADAALSPERARLLLERICAGALRDHRERDIAAARRRVTSIETQMSRLVDALARGDIASEYATEKLARLDNEKSLVSEQLSTLRAALPPRMLSDALVQSFAAHALEVLRSGANVRRYVRRVSVRPDRTT
jgi:DNA invertase Pin-like site-specific DNA recombinase